MQTTPWKAAKAAPPPDNTLFDACFRIQREACAAAGRHIPLIVENVRGAQKWVGRARWNFGSFYLWGDVPALMPIASSAQKFNPDGTAHGGGSWFKIADSQNRGIKVSTMGAGWYPPGHPKHVRGLAFNTHADRGLKQAGISGPRANGKGDRWFQDGAAAHGSKSSARKAASALIAKIPLPLSRWIARTYYPTSHRSAAA